MKRTWRELSATAACAVVVAALAWAPVSARAGAAHKGAEAAAAQVRQATGGRVLGVRRARRDGDTVYAVRVLLPDGRVTTRYVDAAALEARSREAPSAEGPAAKDGALQGR